MELRLRYYGDPVLREKTERVEKFDEELFTLIEDMATLMYREDGAGLAAPQVGINKRLFIEDDGIASGWKAYINPEITFLSDDKELGEEGCLSIPDIFENVERSKSIRLKYQTSDGTLKNEVIHGYLARIIQHETDHLNGILFIDHISNLKKRLLKKKLDAIRQMSKAVYQR